LAPHLGNSCCKAAHGMVQSEAERWARPKREMARRWRSTALQRARRALVRRRARREQSGVKESEGGGKREWAGGAPGRVPGQVMAPVGAAAPPSSAGRRRPRGARVLGEAGSGSGRWGRLGPASGWAEKTTRAAQLR
jgi:hypothetical protein